METRGFSTADSLRSRRPSLSAELSAGMTSPVLLERAGLAS